MRIIILFTVVLTSFAIAQKPISDCHSGDLSTLIDVMNLSMMFNLKIFQP